MIGALLGVGLEFSINRVKVTKIACCDHSYRNIVEVFRKKARLIVSDRLRCEQNLGTDNSVRGTAPDNRGIYLVQFAKNTRDFHRQSKYHLNTPKYKTLTIE